MSSERTLYIIGAGGHARVLLDILLAGRKPVAGLLDIAAPAEEASLWGVPVLHEDILRGAEPEGILLVNGVGLARAREAVFRKFHARSFAFMTLVAPSAEVSSRSSLGEGAQVLHGAIVQAGSSVGRNSIVNTGASVDHDCTVGESVHIAPGAVLCGGVRVGDRAFVGASATVIPGVAIGEGAVVGAGAVVLADVLPGCSVAGVPARPLSRDEKDSALPGKEMG